MVEQPTGGTSLLEAPAEQSKPSETSSWVTVVWDDPVNLFNYVIHVFVNYFHYSTAKATELTSQIHHGGKAIVSSGTREQMETDVAAMHSYGLWATLEIINQ